MDLRAGDGRHRAIVRRMSRARVPPARVPCHVPSQCARIRPCRIDCDLAPRIRYAALDARYALELTGCMADDMTDQMREGGRWKMGENRGPRASVALHGLAAASEPWNFVVTEARETLNRCSRATADRR